MRAPFCILLLAAGAAAVLLHDRSQAGSPPPPSQAVPPLFPLVLSYDRVLDATALIFSAALAALLISAASTAALCWTLLRWGDADSNTDWGQPLPWPLFRLRVAVARNLPLLAARLQPPTATAYAVGMGFAHSKALYAVVKLGVADALAAGPLPAAELAARLGVKADELRRLLRALGSHGIFAEQPPGSGTFANNRGSSVLRSNHPCCLADQLLLAGGEAYAGHAALAESLAPGAPPPWLAASGGVQYFSWLGQPKNAEAQARFDRVMRGVDALLTRALLQDYDWTRHGSATLCEVGGGTGRFLTSLLARRPGMRGVVLDRPSVIKSAAALWAEQPPAVGARVQLVPGDFFVAVPPADIHLLKLTLHDWPDADCLRILAAVHAAQAAGAGKQGSSGKAGQRLLVVDMVLPDQGPLGLSAASSDLQMLALLGGKERSRQEWAALLAAGGFRLVAVHPLRSVYSLIEAVPA